MLTALFLALSMLGTLDRSGEHLVTRANLQRVKAGMTLPQVESILGRPRDYSTGPLVARMSPDEIPPKWKSKAEAFAEGTLHHQRQWQHWVFSRKWWATNEWVTDSLVVSVTFDCEGLVKHTSATEVRRKSESSCEAMLRWLGLRD